MQRYLARRIGPETADDLVAETFVAAMTGYAGYNPMQPIRPWLYGIATNKLRRHLRQERRRYQATAGWPPGICPATTTTPSRRPG